ncbi:MAG: hypothetical protein JWN41_214 [Thermoleophilia bacterium]|nr:hypothetical protein [Thermoleophilia bacterium]
MASAPTPAPLDPTTAAPRDLMKALLPAARAEYIKAWEFLADPATPLERRRLARTRATAIAADHSVVAAFLRERERSLSGDELLNARHLADELDRHVEALNKIAAISVIGLADSKTLRPEALGCGRRYRDPSRTNTESGSASRAVQNQPAAKGRETRDRPRDSGPFSDRGPKAPRDALGTSKHDSPISDDLDAETRAKLEAMRQQLESDER